MLDAAVIAAEPFEIALRLLMKGALGSGPAEDDRRASAARNLRGAAARGLASQRGLRMTIAGALWIWIASGWLTIRAESPRQRGR